MINSRISRPYAHAAFEYAAEHHQLEQWTTMLQALTECVQQPLMKELLKNPHYSDEMRGEACIAVTETVLDNSGKNFVKVLASHHRLNVLPEIYRQYEELRIAREKTLETLVISAIPLTENYCQTLQQNLSKKFGRDVALTYEVDPAILGGIIVRTGDRVIDSSVRGQLERLRDAVTI